LLHHLVVSQQAGTKPKTGYILLLSIFALLSKESGLLIPLVAIVVAIRAQAPLWQRIRGAASWAGLVAFYFLGRFLMFGTDGGMHNKDGYYGYLFGIWHYDRMSDLAEPLRKFCLIDNALKSSIEPFLPVFNNDGGFDLKSISVLLTAVAT